MEDNLAFVFLWKIEDFSLYKWEGGNCIESPALNVYSLEKSSLRLEIYGRGLTDSSCFEVYFRRGSDGPERIDMFYELSFLTAGDSPHVTPRVLRNVGKNKMVPFEKCPTQEEVLVTQPSAFLPRDVLTLQLRLWKPQGVVEKLQECSVITRTISRRFKKLFFIRDFIKLQIVENTDMESLTPFKSDDAKLILKVNKYAKEKGMLDVQVTSRYPSDKHVFCKLSVLDRFEELVMSQKKEGVRDWEHCYKCVFAKFVTRKELIDRKDYLLPQGVLSIVCEFFIMEVEVCEASEFTREIPMDTHKSNCVTSTSQPAAETVATALLQDDLLSLYKKKTLCDFELRAGDARFPVHRNILSARSPFFEALFSGGMRETVSGFQDIPDLDADTLDRMLVFIYTGTAPDLENESAAKLYYASDKYLLSTLKQKCSLYLAANIDLSNICQVLQLAHQHDDDHLKSSTHDFLIRNIDQTIRSDDWKDFMAQNLQVAAETMRVLFSNMEVKRYS